MCQDNLTITEAFPMRENEKINLTMLCDFYELTMGNGYFSRL